MKRKILTSAILIGLMVPVSLPAQRGLTVSFKSRWPVNGTSIGLKLGPLAAYGGVDLVRLAFQSDYESTYYHRDWETDRLYRSSEYESEYDIKARLAIPQAGLKFYAVQSSLKAYLFGEVFLILPSVEGKDKGKDVNYNPDGTIAWIDEWDDTLDKKEVKQIEDILDFFGLVGGFGIEYPLSEQFSIGGEFGFRHIANTFVSDDEWVDEWDGTIYSKETWKQQVEMSLGSTFTSLTLNYTF